MDAAMTAQNLPPRAVKAMANEVRTANSTGDIQALRAQVSAGTYTPDCMAIAGRLLYMAGE